MFQLDAGHICVFGDETNVDFAFDIVVILEFAVEVPAQPQMRGRLPGQHLAPFGLRAVFAHFIPAPAHAGLDHRIFHFDCGNVMGIGPPAAEARGKHFKSMCLRRAQLNGLAHGGDLYLLLHGHGSSLSLECGFSASALKASSAPSQKRSSQARIAPRPWGSMR